MLPPNPDDYASPAYYHDLLVWKVATAVIAGPGARGRPVAARALADLLGE
jgi:Mg-chelatase subunit ChlI